MHAAKWFVSLSVLILGNPGVKLFLKENLHALNFCELHATKWLVSLNALVLDNPGWEIIS